MEMLKVIISAITLISLCLLVFLLNATSPASAGPFGILALFALGYIASLGLVALFLVLGSFIFVRLTAVFVSRRPVKVMSIIHALYFATVLAMAPMMIISLQSIGSVSFYEVSLMVLFVGVGCVFVAKNLR